MSSLRFLIVILVAALAVPLIPDVLQSGVIGAKNGHWFAWLPALAQSLRLLPLAFARGRPLNIPRAAPKDAQMGRLPIDSPNLTGRSGAQSALKTIVFCLNSITIVDPRRKRPISWPLFKTTVPPS